MELLGKVAIVTGGASGIGRAIAAELARAGAHIVIADVTRAEETAAELTAALPDGTSSRVLGRHADVSSEHSVEEMMGEVRRHFGGVDILVNNAALFAETTGGPFETIPLDEWRRVFEVNVLGTYLCSRAVTGSMRERGGGAIVNLASGTVFKGVPWRLHYVTSKGAIVAFTRSLASELGPDNIRVNAIAPGFTMSDGVLANADEFTDSIRRSASSRSLARDEVPADLAGAARFLCGPGAGFVTGQTLVVDGGSAFH
ncbi:MAG TPA: glucose 1-dehydrogenase [Acidimicrobiales bacterium]|nr:glucose 1-dehydrogenase [Acidimicrobiales bacterium]